jgi:O-antigen/teichoic acid export membrane protein
MGNMASQIVSIVGQLAFIPLYLKVWGAASYGSWMICVGVTAYAAILDFGVSQAASNEVISALSRQEHDKAKFWTGLTFRVTFAMALLTLICASFFHSIAIQFITNQLGGKEYADVLYICVALQLALLLVFNMYICMIRAVGANATASWIATACIATETILPAVIAASGGGLSEAAVGFVIPRLLGVVVAGITLHHAASWVLYFETKVNYWKQASGIWAPSLANLLLPGGVALFLQGSLAVVGGMFGAQTAAAYGIARTLSRLPFQLSYVFVRASFPELTKVVAVSNNVRLIQLIKNLLRIFITITAPLMLGYIFFGKIFLEIWTNNGMSFDSSMILLIAVASAIHALWHFLSAPLMASNRHGLFSAIYFSCVCATLIAAKFAPSVIWILILFVMMEVCVLVGAAIQLKLKFGFVNPM